MYYSEFKKLPSEVQKRVYFGACLRRKRKSFNISSKQMAEKIGIDPANYSRIECGKANPGLDTLLAIAGVFHLDLVFGWNFHVPERTLDGDYVI